MNVQRNKHSSKSQGFYDYKIYFLAYVIHIIDKM